MRRSGAARHAAAGEALSMPTFLLVAFSVYGAMHAYAAAKVWAAVPHSLLAAAALVVVGLALTFSPLLVWLLQRNVSPAAPVVAWIVYSWMGFVFLFLWVGLALDLARGIAALGAFSWPLTPAANLAAIAGATLAFAGYGYVEANGLEVERITIATPKLAAARVTVAQISDLHLGSLQAHGMLDRVMARLAQLRPDIVVATGDIVDGRGGELNELARAFHRYRPPLGAFAVTGNHEYITGLDPSLAILREAGFVVVRGQSVHAGPIVITGLDDRGAIAPTRWGSHRAAPAKPAVGDFILLLKHQPVVNGDPAFDLQLSGHIHGGQVFPFGFFTWLAYRVHTGLTVLPDGRHLYVSRGAGTWGPPMRLFARPEIALFTIEGTGNAR